jgi:hypothetical protein
MMFPVSEAPRYLAETRAAVARLQESTSADQYKRLVERAERQLDGLFTVDIRLDPEDQVRIALRERFVPARVKQAILNVATWKLIDDLAGAWTGRRREIPARKEAATVGI